MDFNFDTDIELSNARALIRPLRADDLPHLLPIALQDKDLMRYSPTSIYSKELLKQYISDAIRDRQIKFRYAFIIYDKLKGQYVGSTSFANLSNKDGRVEIGYTWLGKDFRGSGLNTQVKQLLLGYAFDTLQFERVEFKADERNVISRKAIEKLGAVYEGCLRNHMLMSDGFRRNSVYYSILKNEWDLRKDKA